MLQHFLFVALRDTWFLYAFQRWFTGYLPFPWIGQIQLLENHRKFLDRQQIV